MSGRVVVPNPLPMTFACFDKAWYNFVRALDGRVVEIEKSHMMGSDDGPLPGWYIDVSKIPISLDGGVCPWIPKEWLHPAADKVPCDCPLALVMRSGCQNEGHE